MNTFKLDGPGGVSGLKQHPGTISMDTTSPWVFPGNVTVNGTFTAAGQGMEGAQTITSSSANALTVGQNGTTNPAFNVDASASTSVNGVNVASVATGTGPILSAIGSDTNITLNIAAKGTNPVSITPRLTIQGTNTSALAVGPNGITNPTFKVDSSTASAATGLSVIGAAAGSGIAVTTVSSGTDENLTLAAKGAGTVTINPAVVATAGGAANDGVKFGSIGVGLFTGTGAPTFSAMNGSIYVDSNATTTTTRMYVNKSGAGTAGTTWTNLTTAA